MTTNFSLDYRPGLSPALRGFLAEYVAWVEDGAPQHPYFARYYGLCNAAAFDEDVYSELLLLFDDELYPFNTRKGGEYLAASDSHTQHHNRERFRFAFNNSTRRCIHDNPLPGKCPECIRENNEASA